MNINAVETFTFTVDTPIKNIFSFIYQYKVAGKLKQPLLDSEKQLQVKV